MCIINLLNNIVVDRFAKNQKFSNLDFLPQNGL